MRVLLIIIYLAFISLGLPDSLVGTAWPAMQPEFGASLSDAGLVSVIVFCGTVLSSLACGRMLLRFGTGRVTLFSAICTAVALWGMSLTPSFGILCFCAVPLGLGAGGVDAALNAFVAVHYQARHMNWLHCFWGVGASAGPIILSAFLNGASGWRGGFRMVAVLQSVMALSLLITLPLWKRGAAKEEISGETAPASLRYLLRLPGVKAALIAYFCYCAAEMTTALWGASYLTIAKGIEVQIAARWVSLFYLGITVGRFLAGVLAIRIANKTLIRIGSAGILCGLAVLLLPPGDWFLPAGLFLIGFGCAPIYPSMLHRTPELFGKENAQQLMGLQMASAYVGIAVMPPLFGFLAQKFAVTLYPFYIALIALALLLVYEGVNYSKRNTETQN